MRETTEALSTTPEPPSGFETFFKAEYQRLFEAMCLVVRDRAEAEDIAQEAMARVYERWRTIRDPARYAYRTAFNLHRSLRRRLVRAVQLLPAMAPTPADADAVERRLDTLQALASLPSAQREALVLVDWVGMTADQAARVLGIRAVSVRGRVHRARTTLRERIGDQHG